MPFTITSLSVRLAVMELTSQCDTGHSTTGPGHQICMTLGPSTAMRGQFLGYCDQRRINEYELKNLHVISTFECSGMCH